MGWSVDATLTPVVRESKENWLVNSSGKHSSLEIFLMHSPKIILNEWNGKRSSMHLFVRCEAVADWDDGWEEEEDEEVEEV